MLKTGPRILIVGGAGYIGSHMTKFLRQRGYVPVVLDNLTSGHRNALLGAEFIEGDISNQALLKQVLATQNISAVMHFASHISVGESTAEPEKYYTNNVTNTLRLLDAMHKADVHHFIFSSSAAIYGEPKYTPIDETHPKNPLSPYGHSKLMVEQILADFSNAYGFKYASLRYFNAAGADPDGELGEQHIPETHLIPLILQAAAGLHENITIFGTDFDTPDGTCIRDYIHVTDLCHAHLLALEQLLAGSPSAAYNLGNGNGFSVQQVIDTALTVTGRTIQVRHGQRRHGDPGTLVADASRARQLLGWSPQYSDLNIIIEHAWRWQCRNQ